MCVSHAPKPYVREEFRKTLNCDIFAYGFARRSGRGSIG